ncbi:MAG: tRNA-2-methylthio-N6-dimethylallyladenosine synthase [Candidatus Tokpelaia sp. JSC161]|jgi:tRNA-2-methylthio-N6-dimethylallyladenosine synthase|nr:MAG: tRNA-2-methylthio-N6-dimethylallyladenosine synthase [Candidatus Tokpelaia sp. JSC161]
MRGKIQEKSHCYKVFIKTYGCQMNVYDSQRIVDSLLEEGYSPVQRIGEADLVLLNTCHIREKASEKFYSDLGRLRILRESKNSFILGVTGCTAQAEGEEILHRAPVVDFVIGPQTYHRLPRILKELKKGGKVVDIDYAIENKFDYLPLPNKERVNSRGVSAFLTVQEGCDKFCTFCVVPYTRGTEVSRSVEEIIREAEKLISFGVREITLLGQNVNAWHGKGANGCDWSLGKLLFRLAELRGLKRLRYTTSHPCNMDDLLIAAHRDLPMLMPYLHLPIQAGSDRILKLMNRRHSVRDYLLLIERIRRARSDLAFSGDFIVGFPGETDLDFKETLKLVEDVFYASAYSFKYSSRVGTPGSSMIDQVDEDKKDERLQCLQMRLNEQKRQFLESKRGLLTDVLIEKVGRHKGQMIGRSPWLAPVVVETEAAIGTVINVLIQKASTNSFFGAEEIL